MISHEVRKNSFVRRSMNTATAFVAGAAGMLAQLIWARILVQWFGTSSLTIATALAASLAGLAIGAFIFRDPSSAVSKCLGRAGKRPSWLLLLAGVGLLEGLVLYQMDHWFLPFILSVASSKAALITTATLTLVPLNIALGGVLPTLIESDATESTISVGTLYGAETLGGAAGALLAGFWMIQNIGLAATLLIAALIAILVGATAILCSASDQTDRETSDTNELSDESSPQKTSDGRRSTIFAAIFLAGIASLSMEIIWQRALILLVGTDTHSYMIVAVSFLVGVAMGSFLCGWLGTRRQVNLFSYLQLGVAFTSLVAMAVFCELASGDGQRWLMEAATNFEVVSKRFVTSFALLILPSCLTGASFPAAVAMLNLSERENANATGRTYATIASGNIVGVVATGYFLIPVLGLQTSLIVLAGVAATAAGLTTSRWSPSFSLCGLAVFVAGGYFWTTQQPLGLAELATNQHIAFYREGPVATVGVVTKEDETNAGVVSRRMVVDGIVIGENIGGVDEKQKMLAHLPLLIHAMSNPSSNPDSVSNRDSVSKLNAISIGLGTGILAGELATQTSVEHVSCVELSPAVIDASKLFVDDNHDLASLPNATIVQGDGIHFLRRSEETYDCIVSDGKSRPGHAGNVAFFSSDYYRLAGKRLVAQGTFVQWASLDGSLEEVQTIIKTFTSEFEYSYAALAAPDSIYLVGRKSPIRWDEKACDDYLKNAVSLAPYGWRTSDDIRSMAWLDTHEITTSLPPELAVNSLNKPALERFALDIHHPESRQHKTNNLTFLESCLSDELISTSMFDGEPSENATEIRDACLSLVQAAKALADPTQIDLTKSAELHQQALRTFPRLTRGIHLANRLLEQAEELSTSIPAAELANLLKRAASLVPTDVELQQTIGKALIDRKQFDSAAGCFHRVTGLQPDDVQAHVSFARCLIELRKPRAAVRPLTTALKLQPDHEQAKQLLKIISTPRAFP